MYIHHFEWDEQNEDHIARHGVSASDVEEAILLDKPFYQRSREGKYVAYGVAEEGRYLLIVFVLKGNGWIRVITARDMTEREKRFYKMRRGMR